MTTIKKLLISSLVATTLASPAGLLQAREPAILSAMATEHPVWAKQGMVASQEAVATRVGVEILKQGGNAIDAAVAVGYALAVTLPRAGNLGGGGFMLVYLADKQKTVAIDYREMAPGKAHETMYLNAQGDADPRLSRSHGLAVGIPGTVMGMELALSQYGTLPLEKVIAPAIKLAEQGIAVTPGLAKSLDYLKRRLGRWPSTRKIFYKSDGSSYQPGELLIQTDLANSLKTIAKEGAKGFYLGPMAEKIAAAVQEAGGIITTEDLSRYKAVAREPVSGNYRGYQVVSMPPPSSGGVHIIQMLNMLEHYPLNEMGHNSAATIHLMTETMKRAYADRSKYLGDPDFVTVPVKSLTDKGYAKTLTAQISPLKATPSDAIRPGELAPFESDQTTHYSVVDKWGNAVSNTYTLNFSYGSGLVAEGTGILLNNEMDDFSAKPGTPNGYGLIGGHANAVAAYKRPLSSMTPTLVLKDGEPYLVTGSPGGSRIITTTLQILTNVIDHQMNIAEATSAPRIHHQWWPDVLRSENNLSIDTIRLLEQLGHKVVKKPTMGSTQSIMVTDQGLYGASDKRRQGALTAGY